MSIFQIIAVALVGAVLAVTLKSCKPEFSMGIGILTGIIVIAVSIGGMRDVFEKFNYIVEKSGIDARYFELIIKVIGIAYITQFAAEICRDGGQGSIAAKLEMAGKIFIMMLTIPVINNFFELITDMMN